MNEWMNESGVTSIMDLWSHCVSLKELEKKVSQTAPFQNLKQMLQKKNDQIKDLRRRLSKYASKLLIVIPYIPLTEILLLSQFLKK